MLEMPRDCKRLVISMRGRTQQAEVGALADAFEHFFIYLAENGAGATHGTICVPIMGNLDGTLSELLGERRTSRLLRGESLSFREGLEIHARSTRTIRKYRHGGAVLAAFADCKMLNVLDELAGVSAMFVVPWDFDEVQDWIKRRRAEVVGEPQAP